MSASTPAASQPDRPDTVAALAGVPPGSASVPALRLVGLVKTFDRKVAVDQLSLDIPVSSFYGIVGPNGAGKSTTIRVLLGLYRPDEGSVSVLGCEPWRDAAAINRQISYVPGDVALWPALTGGQVARCPGRAARIARR